MVKSRLQILLVYDLIANPNQRGYLFMPLFQNSVLAKYQKTIDKQLLNIAYT